MSRTIEGDSDFAEGLTISGRIFRQKYPVKFIADLFRGHNQEIQVEKLLRERINEEVQLDEDDSEFEEAKGGRIEEHVLDKSETFGTTTSVRVSM